MKITVWSANTQTTVIAVPALGLPMIKGDKGDPGDLTPEASDRVAAAIGAADAISVQVVEISAAAAQAAASRDDAERARAETQSIAATAATAAHFFDTIATGRAAVADGAQFGVRAGGTDGLTRPTVYRRISATDQAFVVAMVMPDEVDDEVSTRRTLVRSASVAGYAAIILDPSSNATWLAARESDGAPPDWVIDHLVSRLTTPMGVAQVIAGLAAEVSARQGLARVASAPGLSVAVIDPSERLTWIAANETDGGMPDWVADHVAERIASRLSLSDASVLATDRALVGGALAPLLPDMTRMAGWGSSTMEYMGTEVAAEMQVLGMTSYFNGGDAGVKAEHVMAAMGARPALLTVAGGQIPASGGVTVTASNVTATALLRAFTGMLAGVPGTLSSTDDALTFTRAAPGAAVAVAAETPFVPTVGPSYRNAATILNIGKNNFTSTTTNTAAEVVAFTAQAFEWLSPVIKRVVVMGHAVNRDTADVSTLRDRVMSANAAYAAQYGPLYFDLQGYMCSPQIWIDAGVTPTQADLDAQARGNKPASLSLDDLHFNSAGDTAVAKALRRFVVALGWYREPSA